MTRYINPAQEYAYIDPVSGVYGPVKLGKLYFYKSQTNTPLDTFKDDKLTIPNTNPVILSADGRAPNIFYEGSARVVLTDANDVQVWERDPVGGDAGLGQFSLWEQQVRYDTNDYVIGSDGKIYKSLINPNEANDPTTSPSSWEEVRFMGVWNTNISYDTGIVVQTTDGNLWKSTQAANAGNDPMVDNGSNWLPAVDIANILSDTNTVVIQTGGGALTALRVNELRDGSAYQLPAANSVKNGQTITLSHPDEYKTNEPLVQRNGSDNITYSGGTDTEILFNQRASLSLTLTSNGVDTWSF
jgi:hypothetical protein